MVDIRRPDTKKNPHFLDEGTRCETRLKGETEWKSYRVPCKSVMPGLPKKCPTDPAYVIFTFEKTELRVVKAAIRNWPKPAVFITKPSKKQKKKFIYHEASKGRGASRRKAMRTTGGKKMGKF